MNQQVKFWKKWIELQLEHNLDYMIEHSIKNFHFPGLNYVCFEFSPKQTIRLYIVEPKDDLDTTNVQIHNHLYDSQTLTAFMVFEFPTVKKHSTLFSIKELGDTIPTPNAYLKYTRDELTALVSGLLKEL